MQSLGHLNCMQLHVQAHTHPAREGLFKTKGAAATAAVLPMTYNALYILYIVVGDKEMIDRKSLTQGNKTVETKPFRADLMCL